MKWHFYFTYICLLFAISSIELQANNALFITPEIEISKSLVPQIARDSIGLSLPLSIFAQEVALRQELITFLATLANNPQQIQLCPDLKEYLNRVTTLKTLVDTYLFFITLKTIMHCQRSHPTPTRLPYAHYELTNNTSLPITENQITQEMEQQISIAEIMELLQHVEEDLVQINNLERSDKKEIINILVARKQYLDRKLKELGILHYSTQTSSFWNSSLPWAITGLCLGTALITLSLASIDHDGVQFNIHLPSKALFTKNLRQLQIQDR